MFKKRQYWIALAGMIMCGTGVAALADSPQAALRIQAPPPAPPIALRPFAPDGAGGGAFEVTSLYSIGEPSDEEQLYLEYLNRARANPAAEGLLFKNATDPDVLSAYGYFSVDLNLMVSQFSSIAVAPPLSLSGKLSLASRGHSQNMLDENFQGHYGTDGSDPGTRMTRQGYTWMTYGENVYASANSVFHGHAGFEVDWGGTVGGMQTPAGHRNNIHNASFREVGIGVINGENDGVGPQLVTQDFATAFNSTPFITGVVYYDLNGNGFYDLGEGIGGVSVVVSNAPLSAVTANSGGYSVPVSCNGSYAVRFAASGLPLYLTNVTVSASKNLKVDYVPAYAAPIIGGPSQVALGQSSSYTFSAVGAATEYEWRRSRRVAMTLLEGAEGGLGRMTSEVSTGYSVVVSDVKATGAGAYHLTHVQPVSQRLALTPLVRPSATSQVTFASRLGWAAPSEQGRLQISTNSGNAWQDLWSRAGTSSSGQTSFGRVTNSLASFAGQEVLLRFAYDFAGGSYYPGSNGGIGWYLDDIGISNAEELTDVQISNEVSGTGFSFVPAQAGNYSLQARARIGSRWSSWGPAVLVTAQAAPLNVTIRSGPSFLSGRAQFDLDVTGAFGLLQVETASSPLGPWSVDGSATVQTVSGTRKRISAALGGGNLCYYRVVVR